MEMQQEIAFPKNQIQQQTQNMVQMAQESSSVLQKKDEKVEQFKKELQQSHTDNLHECPVDCETLKMDLQNRHEESCLANSGDC